MSAGEDKPGPWPLLTHSADDHVHLRRTGAFDILKHDNATTSWTEIADKHCGVFHHFLWRTRLCRPSRGVLNARRESFTVATNKLLNKSRLPDTHMTVYEGAEGIRFSPK